MIYSKRLRLRAVEKTDLPKFYEWINDPEVIAGLGTFMPMSMKDEETWLERTAERDPVEKPLCIDLRQGNDWRLIGNCGLFHLEWVNREVELGIMIGDKTVWDKGYGTEAVTLLLKHAFETLNLNRVYLRVFSSNARARRSYEKVGFVPEGTLRSAFFRNGNYTDVHIMSVLRSEWDAIRERQ